MGNSVLCKCKEDDGSQRFGNEDVRHFCVLAKEPLQLMGGRVSLDGTDKRLPSCFSKAPLGLAENREVYSHTVVRGSFVSMGDVTFTWVSYSVQRTQPNPLEGPV